MSLPEGWYSQICPGQLYLEQDVSLATTGERVIEERVVVVISSSCVRWVKKGWRILMREPSGELRVKDPYFFGGNPKRIF